MSSIDVIGRKNSPIFFLKTKSTPNDAYEKHFCAPKDGMHFEPIFVPVLEHKPVEEGIDFVRDLLQKRLIGTGENSKYGGLVFTSQRAVEAFAKLVQEGKGQKGWPHLQDVPIYTVGPATSRALQAIPQDPPLNILGETGNGEDLAYYMLDHYGEYHRDRNVKPPLLFLVGERRRDIIPKTLMDPSLPSDRRIHVDERIVYDTCVMKSFEKSFSDKLQEFSSRDMMWIVVFSPTGCDAMLRTLFTKDPETLKYKARRQDQNATYVATIGSTTRDFLKKSFDFDPDVCAAKPSPEGVEEAIMKFMSEQRITGTSG